MSSQRLAVAAVLTCIGVAGLYTFALPKSDARSASSAPTALQTNIAIAANMGKGRKQREDAEDIDPASLSYGARKLVEACRGPLGRRGMPTGEGTKAMKACTCVASKLDRNLGGSDNAMKLAGFHFDMLFEPDRNNKQVKNRFFKRAKRYKREYRQVYMAVNSAVKSGCRLKSKLGFPPRMVSSILLRPAK